MTELERLREQLKRLSLNTMASMFEDEANKASKGQMSYTAFLARLVDEEVVSKTDRSVNARIAKARFPAIKTLESFDFSFQPSLPATRIKELAELGFIEHADNVLFVGPTGTGKTHLSIALGLKACNQRKRVLFTSAMSLLDQMVAATVSHTLGTMLETLGRLDLLIIDELGYMSVDTHRSNLFFQVVSRRYEKGAIILSTNKPFDRWGEMFGDDVIASAILDRLLHHSHIIAINGPSYRIKDKLKKLKGKEVEEMPKM
jgi:DNA replication protein DnaC